MAAALTYRDWADKAGHLSIATGLFIDGRLAILYTPYDLMSGVNRESNA